MIAGGSGITPMIQVIKEILNNPDTAAIMPMRFFMFATYGSFGNGPFTSTESPGFNEQRYLDTTPVGYPFTINSKYPFCAFVVIGVYGLDGTFPSSPFSPPTMTNELTDMPMTWLSDGSLHFNTLVS